MTTAPKKQNDPYSHWPDTIAAVSTMAALAYTVLNILWLLLSSH